jgi:hypothetical protein
MHRFEPWVRSRQATRKISVAMSPFALLMQGESAKMRAFSDLPQPSATIRCPILSRAAGS